MKRKNNLKKLFISPLWYITALPLMGCFEKQRDPNESANTSNSPANANTPPNASKKNTLPTPEGTAYPTHTDTLSKTEQNESSRQSTVETPAGSSATASVNEIPEIAQGHGRDANSEATQIRLEDARDEAESYIDCILNKKNTSGKVISETEIEAYLARAIEAVRHIYQLLPNGQVRENNLPLLESLSMLLGGTITIGKSIISSQNLFSKVLIELEYENKVLTNARNEGEKDIFIFMRANEFFNSVSTYVKNITTEGVQLMQKVKEVIELSKIPNNLRTKCAIASIDKKVQVIKELETEVSGLCSLIPKPSIDFRTIEDILRRTKNLHNIGKDRLIPSLISVRRCLLIIEKNILQSLKATP